MKLPFVLLPRGVYDDLRADLAQLRAEVKEQRDTITRMKLSGGTLVALANGGPEAKKLEPRELSRFEIAVAENGRAQRDPRLKANLLRWADDQMRQARERTDDLDELDELEARIETRLRGWNAVSDGDDDEDEDDDVVPIATRTTASLGGR